MFKAKTIFTFLLILFFAGSNALNAQEVLEILQNKYNQINSFQAEFTQTLTNAASGEQNVRRGMIYFKKPRHIRWETKTPEEELLITSGEVCWDYFPAEKIAYKYSLQGIFKSKTLLQFITGQAELDKEFKIKHLGQEKGWKKIELIPHEPEPEMVLAYLWIDEQSYLIKQILIVDFWKNGNQITFENIRLDVSLRDSLFEFSPPDEVQVQERMPQQ